MNYKNYLATLFLGASMLIAGTDKSYANTNNADNSLKETIEKEVSTPITVAQYFQLGPDARAEMVYNFLKQYTEFLYSPMESGQRKL